MPDQSTSDTQKNIRLLEDCLNSILIDSKATESISFHIGDIVSEIAEAAEIFQEIKATGKISKDQFQRISYMLGIHWHYHLNEVSPHLMKALDDLE
jgi:hypothetical protein